jgi:hypothetical protein
VVDLVGVKRVGSSRSYGKLLADLAINDARRSGRLPDC